MLSSGDQHLARQLKRAQNTARLPPRWRSPSLLSYPGLRKGAEICGALRDGVRRYRSRAAPQGRAAAPATGTGHAYALLVVTVGTTRDAAPLMPPTARS